MTEPRPSKYGCPLVTMEEIDVAALSLSIASNYAIHGQGARNLAYAALVAVRTAHFNEAREMGAANGEQSPTDLKE